VFASNECVKRFISENTVKMHLRNVYRKTGTASRGDLLWQLVMGPGPAAEGAGRPVGGPVAGAPKQGGVSGP